MVSSVNNSIKLMENLQKNKIIFYKKKINNWNKFQNIMSITIPTAYISIYSIATPNIK